MDTDDEIERFHELSKAYDQLFGPGKAIDLKDELGLGRGRFNDELTTEEIRELNEELDDRLSNLRIEPAQ